tara:strand:+ start:1046 stop:1369 length:324 start_codon:yes stop_codon:yes gene_type:complete
MNKLPCDIINNILIIHYDKEIRELKMKISKLQEILIEENYSCCEYCDDWFHFKDLSQTLQSDYICDDCQVDNDLLPCHSCGRLDYCEDIIQSTENGFCYDYCSQCHD